MNSPSTPPPLHVQNPLERFSDRAQDYAKYRPTYPPAAIDLILQGFPDPTQLQVADIGAGTGISARLLAERGVTVWAIEPNAAMRAAATPHPQVTFLAGTAEQTGLPEASVDLIVCAQSFHWFDKPIALAEFHRILKPQGRVALMWNDRDLTDAFTQEYSEIVRRSADRQIFDREDRKSGAALQASPLFINFQAPILFHHYPLDQASLLGLVLSASYVPKSGAAYEQLIADLQSLYQRWVDRTPGDGVPLSYRVNLYLADRAER